MMNSSSHQVPPIVTEHDLQRVMRPLAKVAPVKRPTSPFRNRYQQTFKKAYKRQDCES